MAGLGEPPYLFPVGCRDLRFGGIPVLSSLRSSSPLPSPVACLHNHLLDRIDFRALYLFSAKASPVSKSIGRRLRLLKVICYTTIPSRMQEGFDMSLCHVILVISANLPIGRFNPKSFNDRGISISRQCLHNLSSQFNPRAAGIL